MTVGWETLDVGEKALVYSKNGRVRIEEGPQRLFLFREKFKRMPSFSASQKEFLKIVYRDGRVEHVKGPCIRHENSILHICIQVHNLISLDANEALVVYSQNLETKHVQRRVQFGPTLFMLGENDWLHEFSWHGTDPENKTRMIKDQNKFTVLKIIPDQFYYNVDEVRTSDDALLRIKLMMFYELVDIDKMLNSTKDPMADLINCLCADVVAFTAKTSYEEFIETASELNDLKNYKQLMERCPCIGYTVSKVVFRGYFAHEKLQKMHDMMIKRRTELRLQFDREVQEQTLIDKKLQADIDRLEQEQQIELENLLHVQKLELTALQHSMSLEKESHEKHIEKKLQESKAKLEAKIVSDNLDFKHWNQLNQIHVDVNKVLEQQAAKPLKVTSIAVQDGAASVHFHYNDPQRHYSNN
ncbi:type II secretion system (T2SS) protein E N-terminal domain [Biomphalaria glabrata]|nr:CAunnamed protein product [Biomphalaria glabrata]